jgi:hypothetical protein
MSLKPITVLRRARKLIADPSTWIKGSFTRKRKGVQCYCALGALASAAGVKILNGKTLSDEKVLPEAYYEAHGVLNAAAKLPETGWFFAIFNDSPKTTHADVLAVFDKAIQLAKA